MDKGSAIGLMLLIVAITGGILSSNAPLISYINMPSIFIVVVGTFGAVMIAYRLHVFFEALFNISKAFKGPPTDPLNTIEIVVDMADVSRKGGFLALESVEVDDPFIMKARNLLIDGHDADTIDIALRKDIMLTKQRNDSSVKVLNSFTETAPSMGMVGTLIGLVAMLLNMDDPKTIGKSMSVALLTTLYGALLAFGITGPLARKLSERSAEITLQQSIVRDGFARIINGENPKAIHEFLQSYVHEKRRRPHLNNTRLETDSQSSSTGAKQSV